MTRGATAGRAPSGRSAVTNASYVATAEVLAKLSTMVWTVVAAQKLGQFGFGVFNLALALGLILIAVGGWGFTSVFVRRASRDTSRVSQYFTEIVVWQGGLTAPLVLLGVVVYSVVTPETTAVVPMAMVLLAGLFDLMSDTARAASSTVHRQGTTSLALIAQRLITTAVAIPAVMIWGSVLALSVAFLFSSLLGVVLHGFALGRLGIRFRPRLLTMDGLRHSLRGTHWIGLGGVARDVQYRAGFILLAALVGEVAVGSYSAAFRLFETVLFLSFALEAAIFPLMSLERTRTGLRRLSEASVSILMGFYLPFAVVCLLEAPRLIELFFGAQYVADSSGPLRWFAAAPLLFAIAFIGAAALVALSRTKGVLLSAVAATVTCLALALLLIPRYEAVGAAVALTVAAAVEALLITVVVRRALGQWPRYLRHAVQPALCSLVALAVLWLLDAPFIVELAASAIVYIGCWGSLLWWSRSSAARLLQAIPGATDGDDHQALETEGSWAAPNDDQPPAMSAPHGSEAREREGTTHE